MASENKKPMVDYNFLGPHCGLKVSNICLGTMTFGKPLEGILDMPGHTDEAASHKILDKFYELGGNFIDTANFYTSGESEKIVGSWMKKVDRDEIVVATKVRISMNRKNVNDEGLGRSAILSNVEKSLKRLQTDHIDLYYSHCWDKAVKIEETLRTFDDLVRSGKVRYVGVSNVTGAQLQKIVDYNKFLGFNQCVALQAEYNLAERSNELELVDVCEEEGVSIVPYSPLKGGLLTGKFKKDDAGKALAGTRLGWTVEKPDHRTFGSAPHVEKYRSMEEFWKLIELMEKLAKKYGKTVAQVALRWLLQKELVPSVIIGAKTVQQLEDNMAAGTGWELTVEEMSQLDAASSFSTPPPLYPYEFINRVNHGRSRKC